MRLNIKPLRDRIIVKQDDSDQRTDIYLPTSRGIIASQEQRGRCGTVIEVSDDIDQDQLKPGDRVMYGEFDYPIYRENGIIYQLLSDQDIVGVIE